jgi:hypothetical protein
MSSTNDNNSPIIQQYSWGYVNKNPEVPLHLFNPEAMQIIGKNENRYAPIYYMLQDHHVAEQCKFFDQYKHQLGNFDDWRRIPLSHTN